MKETEENYALKLCPFCGGTAEMKMLTGLSPDEVRAMLDEKNG